MNTITKSLFPEQSNKKKLSVSKTLTAVSLGVLTITAFAFSFKLINNSDVSPEDSSAAPVNKGRICKSDINCPDGYKCISNSCVQQKSDGSKTANTPTVPKVYAIGDSITFGHKNCTPNCELEPNTYLSLYANKKNPANLAFYNLAYSSSTASCPGNTCTLVNNVDAAATFKNAYLNPETKTPNTQLSTQTVTNLVNKKAPGVTRAQLGEFDGIENSDVIIAYGRNDVNNPSIDINNFKQSLRTIISKLQNKNNKIILLTIPPMSQKGWSLYQPIGKRRTDFNNLINNSSNPIELDSFFSAQIWELAAENNLNIVPVHEYFKNNSTSNYFSTDEIHPSTKGHALIFNLLSKQTYIEKVDLSYITNNEKFVLTSSREGYGQAVYRDSNNNFVYSEPFKIADDKPFVGLKIADKLIVYSNVKLTTDKLEIQSRAFLDNGSGNGVDSITAYGRGYNWNIRRNGITLPWSNNGFDLHSVQRYVNGPCSGIPDGKCEFDTREFIKMGNSYVESITAYGKGFNYNANGTVWGSSDFDLTTVPRYAQGPCLGKAPLTCKFDTRAMIGNIESITANGMAYNFNPDGSLWSQPFDLTTISRYAQGPCEGKSSLECKFDSVTMIGSTESISAYGKTWNW